MRITTDPVVPTNGVALFSAEGKQRSKVGKSHLVHRFSPLAQGHLIEMQARFYLDPHTGKADSLILMDLECASCGLTTNPGIRLYLKNGMLRIDLSKIGIKQAILPYTFHSFNPGQWNKITWHVLTGVGDTGKTAVFLNGQEVINYTGTNILSQAIVKERTNTSVKEAVDRFQIGITANSNAESIELLVDDIAFFVQ